MNLAVSKKKDARPWLAWFRSRLKRLYGITGGLSGFAHTHQTYPAAFGNRRLHIEPFTIDAV